MARALGFRWSAAWVALMPLGCGEEPSQTSTSGNTNGGSSSSEASTSGGSGGADDTSSSTDSAGSGSECASGDTACGDECVDLTSTSEHCGTCDNPCESGRLCRDGACQDECAPGFSLCRERCVDQSRDATNCGACDYFCAGNNPCFEGKCGCPEGALACRGTCVDPNTDPSHCGDCGEACAPGEACVAGACLPGQGCSAGSCECDAGSELCRGTCVDTSQGPLDCGACDTPCSFGERCQDGACSCVRANETLCDGVCINTLTDPNHCGSCGNSCPGQSPCIAGVCTCPGSEVLCDDGCFDLTSDVSHCGACDSTCPEGESCVLGECSGAAGDFCPNQLAHSITIDEIAIYQAGKISLMRERAAVEPAAREVAVVAGKQALVRVSVSLGPEWTERVVSARLFLTNGATSQALFQKKVLTQNSSDAALSSTFNFDVSPSLLGPETTYAVEIVECDVASGTLIFPRFPEADETPLTASNVGALKVEFIPIIANGITPDTSQDTIAAFRVYLESVYPVTHVEDSLGAPLSTSYTLGADGTGWPEVLQELALRHQLDGAPNDLYYFGLTQPAADFAQYCSNGCVNGNAYVTELDPAFRHLRVAMGTSYGLRISVETAAHELGHAHGREHVDCGDPDNVDAAYPHADGLIGWWGLEYPNLLYPGTLSGTAEPATDLMGYCPLRWVSDYTYQALLERITLINAALFRIGPSAVGRWRTLVVSPSGWSWSGAAPGETPARGKPEGATVFDAEGNALAAVTVYRARMALPGSASLMLPEPEAGWHAIQLEGVGTVPFAGDPERF